MSDSIFVSVCYHYLKSDQEPGLFPRILGHPTAEFQRHLKMLGERFQFVSLDDVLKLMFEGVAFKGDRRGVLITCDDGLREHYGAAQLLAEHGIKAVFFVPTCILREREPANPNVIHHVIAHCGIAGFLKHYRNALEEYSLDSRENDIVFEKGLDDPWKVISVIKNKFKYTLSYSNSRKILLHVFKNSILRDFPDAMDRIYMTQGQVGEILNMGHSIGAHSHSHPSVGFLDLNPDDFHKEVVEPRKYLAQTYRTDVVVMSYPFGERQDTMSSEDFLQRASEYRLGFTLIKKSNSGKTEPHEIGRYSSSSRDTAEDLEKVLSGLVSDSE